MVEGDVAVARHPLKPDDSELLEETKDYIYYPKFSPIPEQTAVGGSSA
jgi:hypothetical protein